MSKLCHECGKTHKEHKLQVIRLRFNSMWSAEEKEAESERRKQRMLRLNKGEKV